MFIGHVAPGEKEARMLVSRACLIADSLDAVRAMLPPDLIKQARVTDDDPTIVETWF